MSWSTCSPDIIYLIFKSVDDRSLLICLTICQLWRNVAYHIIQTKRMWRKLAEDNLFNKALSFKQKSALSWRDMCCNFLFWISLNTIKVEYDKSWDLRRNNVKAIHVLKDKIIVVYDSDVEYFEAESPIRVMKQPSRYAVDVSSLIDYQETEHISVIHFNKNELNVSFKHNSTKYTRNCNIYKLIDDRCYVVDTKGILWRYKCCGRSYGERFLMRNYESLDSLIDMNVYGSEVYIMVRNGNILQVKERGWHYRGVAQLDRPNFHKSPLIAMCLRHSVVYSVPCVDGSDKKTVTRIQNSDEMVIECPGLTCATPHGEILLLGYEDGTVEVCHGLELLRENKNSLKFNIMDHVKQPLEDASIVAIDAYEAYGGPHLFVATKLGVFKMVLYQLSY